MRRWASRKKSPESITSAARLNASLWSRIAPRTDRSASRLCGSVRSDASVSAMNLLRGGSFSHDVDLDGGRDFAVELERDLERAELLDRLGQLQFPAIDLDAPRFERRRDVGRRDRAEQHVVFADLPGDGDFESAHPGSQSLGGLGLLGFLGLELPALSLDLLPVAVGGEQRQLARQQVV